MNRRTLLAIGSSVLFAACAAADAPSDEGDALTATPKLLDGFETAASASLWTEAAWADASHAPDGSALVPTRSASGATEGISALSVPLRFDGQGYAQGYVGRSARVSMKGHAALAADVTLPASAPRGLRAKFILFLGSDARWTEPLASTELVPGAAVRVALPLAGAFDPVPDRALYADVRGYGLKIEGSSVRWAGSLAVDRVRLEPLPPAPQAEDAPLPVGTFGGFVRSGKTEIPTKTGLLAFTVETRAADLPFLWPRLGEGAKDFSLGSLRFATWPEAARPPRFVDWVTVEATAPASGGQVRTTLSRAFPAVRARTGSDWLEWVSGSLFGRTPARQIVVVLNGKPTAIDLDAGGASLATMSEPWMLVYAGAASGWPFDAPMLLTFERRPASAYASVNGVAVTFNGAAGAVNAMPLDGLRRRANAETAQWRNGLPADVLDRARRLVPLLAAFPTSCSESSELRADGTVLFTNRCAFEELSDSWGTRPIHATPLPPSVVLASKGGYPVQFPLGAVETNIATFFGPWTYVQGDRAEFAVPQPAGLTRLPIALRVKNDPAAAKARAELERIVREQTPKDVMPAFLDNDDRVAALLAESGHTFAAGSAEAAAVAGFAARAIEHGWHDANLQELVEPVTGQRYLNSAKYWASTEPFDKEWYTGRQLAALALVAEQVDLDVARGVWPKARAMYRYDRLFTDWATGSALSSTQGWTALCDGIHFAWEGMLGTARLAKLLGDDATYRDAAARAARQQTALFAAWKQAAWSRDLGYAVGHVANAPLPSSEVEARFGIDGWTEEFGAATLEMKSFWQTANYLFFDNVPQLSLYRDFGLDAAVRTLEYDVMPALHPRWTDANAKDPVEDKFYGTEFTAAHLMARALLFHDDPAALLSVYEGTKDGEGSKQWYSMHRLGIAGPTLLAIERAKAPVVEAPVAQARVRSATWDAAAGVVSMQLVGRSTGSAKVRWRKPGGEWKTTPVWLTSGLTTSVTLR